MATQKSRTYYTLKNAQVTLIFFILQVVVGFVSRKIFLDYLGAEVIGLNTTLTNILNFINLAEMGIGIAMSSALYKPIFDEDHNAINEMMSIQGYLYRKIAYLFVIISIPFCLLVPYIFSDIDFPLWYVYVTYFVGLWGTILGYIWNYRQILLAANQKNYKLTPYIQGGRVLKTVVQLGVILFFRAGYIGYLVVEFLYNTIVAVMINRVVKKEYPWLSLSIHKGKDLMSEYKQLTVMTKQVFFHKVSGFVLTETAPLLIFMYVSLSMVTYYGNYKMLIGYAFALINTLFAGMGASVGNLVAEDNKQHVRNVFWELFTSRMWIAGLTTYSLYIFIPPFIEVWLGGEYLLDDTTLLLMLVSVFIGISRTAVESFKESFKLFGDIWAPIIETVVNLGGALLLGYFWGLNGILLGANLSLVLVVLLWKPYYVFKKGFNWGVMEYFKEYLLQLTILIAAWFISKEIMSHIPFDEHKGYGMVFLSTTIGAMVYAIISFCPLYYFTDGMKSFFNRLLRIAHLK